MVGFTVSRGLRLLGERCGMAGTGAGAGGGAGAGAFAAT